MTAVPGTSGAGRPGGGVYVGSWTLPPAAGLALVPGAAVLLLLAAGAPGEQAASTPIPASKTQPPRWTRLRRVIASLSTPRRYCARLDVSILRSAQLAAPQHRPHRFDAPVAHRVQLFVQVHRRVGIANDELNLVAHTRMAGRGLQLDRRVLRRQA